MKEYPSDAFLHFEKFKTVPLQHEPCPFLVVPEFVEPEALEKINNDYPNIAEPGNFPLDGLHFGPAFQQLSKKCKDRRCSVSSPEKFRMNLNSYPTQMTIRRYASSDDGHIHNNSVMKKITVLVYLNRT